MGEVLFVGQPEGDDDNDRLQYCIVVSWYIAKELHTGINHSYDPSALEQLKNTDEALNRLTRAKPITYAIDEHLYPRLLATIQEDYTQLLTQLNIDITPDVVHMYLEENTPNQNS